jgi:hypothetical protein
MSSFVHKRRLDHLSARLAGSRTEKAGLSTEIGSTSTTPERRKEALIRYAEVVAALRDIEQNLVQLRGK